MERKFWVFSARVAEETPHFIGVLPCEYKLTVPNNLLTVMKFSLQPMYILAWLHFIYHNISLRACTMSKNADNHS
jgi:hypothetical protein